MNSNSKILFLMRSLIIVMIFSLAGCIKPQFFELHRVDSQPKAGTVNLSVTLVAPWEDYVATLQPKFNLTEEKALSLVIPKTTLMEEKLIDALSLKAKVGLPQTSTTKTETTRITEQATSTDIERIESRKPGQIPEETALLKPPEKSAATLPGIGEKERSFSEEPFLEYSAAAALYQEVQLLNRYVEDAALKYKYQPYVVRLQIGVVPYARNQPYDVYTTFSFFPSFDKDKSPEYKKAFVIPLLVTDTLEGMLKSRTSDIIRQLAFALSFMVESVTAEAGISKFREDLRTIIGTDINSLMTVNRVADSAIMVRLGAVMQPTAGYAMIPRNFSITFLLMVPKKYVEDITVFPNVMVVGKSVFRDSYNGKPLSPRPKSEESSEMAKILKRYDSNADFSEVIGPLFACIFKNDYLEFRNKLIAKSYKCERFTREIWLQFIEDVTFDEFSGATFDLPRPVKLDLPDENQSVLLVDDGKNVMTGQLLGGASIIPNRMSARLNLKLKDDQTIIPLIATSISVSPGGKDPILIFPSLNAWKIKNMNSEGSKLKDSTIEVFHTKGDRWSYSTEQKKKTYHNILCQVKEKEDPPPNFKLRTDLDSIAADANGGGSLQLHLETKKENNKLLVDTVEIKLHNAQIVSVEPTNKAKIEFGKIIAKEDATLKLTLINLIDGKKMTINAIGKKEGELSGGVHPEIELSIHKSSK